MQPPRSRRATRIAALPASAAAAVGLAYLVQRSGVFSGVFDAEVHPQPPFVPQLVDAMVAVNEGIRTAAPYAAIGALCLAGYYQIAGLLDEKKKTLNRHSLIEYCGADDIRQAPRRRILPAAVTAKLAPITRGLGLTVLAVMLISATSGVEHEVSNGPLRPIKSVVALFGSGAVGDNRDYSLLLQSPNITFMDDSVIPAAEMQQIVGYGAQHGVTVIPFGKSLMNINGQSALELSLPDQLFGRITGTDTSPSCTAIPVIVDSTVKTNARGEISINNVAARPIGHRAGIAQMNRSIAFVSDTGMRCITRGADSSYFGAFAPNTSPAQLERLAAVTGVENTDATGIASVSEATFEANNRKFWRANGTPILLQMMAYIAIFGAAASAGQVRNALQRNIREIGILNAGGVRIKDVRGVEDRRALWETLWAGVIAAPIIPVLAAAFNAAELGMQVGVGPRELAVGLSITLVAKLLASRRAVARIGSTINLPQAVKG